MGQTILRGISTALIVTVLTIVAGRIWQAIGLSGVNVSTFVDIGLMLSCMVGGYRTGKESGVWFLGGLTGAGYVTLGTILLALFLPIRGLGFLQILLEGILVGVVAGAAGAGKRQRILYRPSRPSYFGERSSVYYPGSHKPVTDPDSQSLWSETGDKEPLSKQQEDNILGDYFTDTKGGAQASLEQGGLSSLDRPNTPRWTYESQEHDKLKLAGYGQNTPWWEEDFSNMLRN